MLGSGLCPLDLGKVRREGFSGYLHLCECHPHFTLVLGHMVPLATMTRHGTLAAFAMLQDPDASKTWSLRKNENCGKSVASWATVG